MKITRWLADVLTASRYCASLEQRLQEQRQDFTERLGDKDARIKELRTELAGAKLESDRMRSMHYGIPPALDRPGKPPVVPEFDGPLDWNAELQRMIQEEEANGIREQGQVDAQHESGPSDAA